MTGAGAVVAGSASKTRFSETVGVACLRSYELAAVTTHPPLHSSSILTPDPKCSPMARFRKRTYADPTDIVRTVALGNYGGDIRAQSCGSTRQKIVFTICPYFNARFESIAYRTHNWRAEQMSFHLPIYLEKGFERYLPSLLPLLPPSPTRPTLFPQARTPHCRGPGLTLQNRTRMDPIVLMVNGARDLCVLLVFQSA